MSRAILAGMLALGLASSTGCHCTLQYLRCLKQHLCCCNPCCEPCCDPCCEPCGEPCCEPCCEPGHGGACHHAGCGEAYLGDPLAVASSRYDPCDKCGNWTGMRTRRAVQTAGGQCTDGYCADGRCVKHASGHVAERIVPQPAQQPTPAGKRTAARTTTTAPRTSSSAPTTTRTTRTAR